jgi:hypothetical protein
VSNEVLFCGTGGSDNVTHLNKQVKIKGQLRQLGTEQFSLCCIEALTMTNQYHSIVVVNRVTFSAITNNDLPSDCLSDNHFTMFLLSATK